MKSRTLTEIIHHEPQELLDHMYGFVRTWLFSAGQFQVCVDAACNRAKFRGTSEWFELSLSCLSGPSTVSANEDHGIKRDFGVLSFKDSDHQVQKFMTASPLGVAHPSPNWLIPLAGAH